MIGREKAAVLKILGYRLISGRNTRLSGILLCDLCDLCGKKQKAMRPEDCGKGKPQRSRRPRRLRQSDRTSKGGGAKDSGLPAYFRTVRNTRLSCIHLCALGDLCGKKQKAMRPEDCGKGKPQRSQRPRRLRQSDRTSKGIGGAKDLGGNYFPR